MENKTTQSRAIPSLLTVDADIPEGTAVAVKCIGKLTGVGTYSETVINPAKAPIGTATEITFTIELRRPPRSLAAPFVYGLLFEGEHQTTYVDAVTLAASLEPNRRGLTLIRPQDTKPYLTCSVWAGSIVTMSPTKIPYTFEIVGSCPSDSSIVFNVSGIDDDGEAWQNTLTGCAVHELMCRSISSIKWQLALIPSSDGKQTPALTGIAISGDERRYFIQASQVFGDSPIPDSYKMFSLPDGTSLIILNPTIPNAMHSGPPPILGKLLDLHANGAFRLKHLE